MVFHEVKQPRFIHIYMLIFMSKWQLVVVPLGMSLTYERIKETMAIFHAQAAAAAANPTCQSLGIAVCAVPKGLFSGEHKYEMKHFDYVHERYILWGSV